MADRNWLKERPAYTSKGTVRAVEGQDISFYPVSGHVALMLRAVARPVAKLISHLTDNSRDGDRRVKHSMFESATDKGANTDMEPVTLDVIQFRANQRSGAIDEFLESLFSEEVLQVLGCLIIDSMRPRDDIAPPDAAEGGKFARGLDLPIMRQYLAGVVAANGAAFGPLGEALGQLKTLVAQRVKAAVDQPGSPSSPLEASADVPAPTPTLPHLVASD